MPTAPRRSADAGNRPHDDPHRNLHRPDTPLVHRTDRLADAGSFCWQHLWRRWSIRAGFWRHRHRLVSINVAFTGFCPIGNILQMLALNLCSAPKRRRAETFIFCNRQVVSRAAHLPHRGHQYLHRIDSSARRSPWWTLFHRFRRVRNGVVLPPPVIAFWPISCCGSAPSRASTHS